MVEEVRTATRSIVPPQPFLVIAVRRSCLASRSMPRLHSSSAFKCGDNVGAWTLMSGDRGNQGVQLGLAS